MSNIISHPLALIGTKLQRSAHTAFVFLRYTLLSLSTSGIDFCIFMLSQSLGATLALSFILARLASILYNFPLSKKAVFQSTRPLWTTLSGYLLLVIINGIAAYFATRWLIQAFSFDATCSKMIAETSLFFVNFVIQRSLVFTGRSPTCDTSF